MTKHHWLLIALAIAFSLALAACGSGAKQAAPTQAPGAAATGAPTASPAAASPTEAPAKPAQTAPTATAIPGDNTLDLGSREVGLDKLTSYRLTWHAKWTSTDQGKTESGAWDWVEEYTSEPKAQHISMKSPDSNDPTKISTLDIWQIGDTTYMKTGDDQKCVSLSSQDSATSMEQRMFNPSLLGSIQNATYLGTDTINGVPAKHYKYSSKAGTLAGLSDFSGETWVAIDGGYVVKDVVTWKGGAGLFGLSSSKTATGDGTWTWELADANQPFEIKQAADCQAAAALNLPMMPDATEKSQFGEMVTYKTASKVADVAAFYKNALPAAGWTAEGEPTEMGEIAMLSYTKDGKTLSVTITTSDNTTQVLLSIGE